MFGNIIFDLFVKGGPIMWPILICFFAAVIVVLERAIWWLNLSKRARSAELEPVFDSIADGKFEEALKASDAPANPFLQTIHDGLSHAHSSLLGAMQLKATDDLERGEKGLWLLSTFITLAPLLGLLGTVAGIMRSFNFVGDEQLAAAKVSGGIAEALIATACGLAVAILCLLPYNYFNRRLARYRSQMERIINHVELLVESAKHHGHDLEEFSKERALEGKTSMAPAFSLLAK
jgi:biopolymer transport protein ExbB